MNRRDFLTQTNEIKKTIVAAGTEAEFEQYERDGFMPVCQYRSMAIEPNEIGGIFTRPRNFRVVNGMGTFDAECIERIYAVPST